MKTGFFFFWAVYLRQQFCGFAALTAWASDHGAMDRVGCIGDGNGGGRVRGDFRVEGEPVGLEIAAQFGGCVRTAERLRG